MAKIRIEVDADVLTVRVPAPDDRGGPVAEAEGLLDGAGNAPDAATLDRLEELYATLGHQAGCVRTAGNGMGPCDCLRGEVAAFLEGHGRGV